LRWRWTGQQGTIPVVKFGLLPPYRAGVTVDPQWMTTFARAAEACGFESLYSAEHVVVAAGYTSRYPYNDTGRMPVPHDADLPGPTRPSRLRGGSDHKSRPRYRTPRVARTPPGATGEASRDPRSPVSRTARRRRRRRLDA